MLESKKGAVNDTKTIIDEDDVTALRNEMTDTKLRKTLVRSHDLANKTKLTSTIKLHKVVAIQVNIRKLPYSWR